mgnify:CR=1 FL=1
MISRNCCSLHLFLKSRHEICVTEVLLLFVIISYKLVDWIIINIWAFKSWPILFFWFFLMSFFLSFFKLDLVKSKFSGCSECWKSSLSPSRQDYSIHFRTVLSIGFHGSTFASEDGCDLSHDHSLIFLFLCLLLDPTRFVVMRPDDFFQNVIWTNWNLSI